MNRWPRKPPGLPDAGRRFPALLFFPLFCILVYGHTLRSPFHFDDRGLIERNTEIRDWGDPLRVIISNDPGHRHRPLLMLSLGLNYHFSGNNVFGYHLFNLLLHTGSSILLYTSCLLLWRLSLRRELPRPEKTKAVSAGMILLAVLFYTVQPMNTEAITYISGRSSSMSTFFLLLAFCLFLKSRVRRIDGILSWKAFYAGTAVLAYCLSLASKEIGIVLPALLLAADYYLFSQPDRGGKAGPLRFLRRCGPSFLPYLLVILIFLFIRYKLQGAILEKHSAFLYSSSRASYFFTELNVMVHYLRKIFLPFNQNIDISFPIHASLFDPSTISSSLLILLIILTAIRGRFTALWFSFAVFWFFTALSPTSSFVPILDVAVERRLYMSGIALTFFLLSIFSGMRVKKIALFAPLLVLFSSNAIVRNSVYRDPVALWSDSASKAIYEPRPHFNYAKSLKMAGRPEAALAEYNTTLSFPYSPYNDDIHNSKGVIYMKKGLYQKAVEEFRRALRVNKNYDLARNNLGVAYFKMGKIGKAGDTFRKALRINPDNTEARNNLGVIYAKQRMYQKARREFTSVLRKNPKAQGVRDNMKKLEHGPARGNIKP